MEIHKNYDGTVYKYNGEQIPSEYGDFLAPGESGEISNLYPVPTYRELCSGSGGGASSSSFWWLGWPSVWAMIIIDFLYGYFSTGSSTEATLMVFGHICFLIKGFFLLICLTSALFWGAVIGILHIIFC